MSSGEEGGAQRLHFPHHLRQRATRDEERDRTPEKGKGKIPTFTRSERPPPPPTGGSRNAVGSPSRYGQRISLLACFDASRGQLPCHPIPPRDHELPSVTDRVNPSILERENQAREKVSGFPKNFYI